jgi:hypothetical protein
MITIVRHIRRGLLFDRLASANKAECISHTNHLLLDELRAI